jgi:hypothetical protein
MAAYKDAPFNAKFEDYLRPISDEDRLRFTEERLSNTKALWQEGMSLLDRIGNANVDKEAEYLIDELNEEFEMMIKAHTILGPARIAELGYNKRRIETAMGEVQENKLLKSEPMLKAVYGRLNTGDIVSVTDATRFMKEVIESNGIPYKHRFDRKLVELYFEISDKRTNSARYYVFGKKKLNI